MFSEDEEEEKKDERPLNKHINNKEKLIKIKNREKKN